MTLVLSGDLRLENNDAEEKKWDAFLRQRGEHFAAQHQLDPVL